MLHALAQKEEGFFVIVCSEVKIVTDKTRF